MSSFWIVESIYVFEQGNMCLFFGVPGVSPNHTNLNGLKECFHDCIIVTVAFAAQREVKSKIKKLLLKLFTTNLKQPIHKVLFFISLTPVDANTIADVISAMGEWNSRFVTLFQNLMAATVSYEIVHFLKNFIHPVLHC